MEGFLMKLDEQVQPLFHVHQHKELLFDKHLR